MKNIILIITLCFTLSSLGQHKAKKLSDLETVNSTEAKKLDRKIQSLDNEFVYLEGYKAKNNTFIIVAGDWKGNYGKLFFINSKLEFEKNKDLKKSDLKDIKNIKI